jgi:hypothetical protein
MQRVVLLRARFDKLPELPIKSLLPHEDKDCQKRRRNNKQSKQYEYEVQFGLLRTGAIQ